MAVINYFIELSTIEFFAVFTAFLYVILAAKESNWCWPAALASTLLYTIIFYDVYLWMDSLLQLYYFAMAIYGWYCWRVQNAQANKAVDSQPKTIQIQTWTLREHSVAIGLLVVISLVAGYVMANYTPTHFPYTDAATTVFAVFATYLVTQKVVENWLYWIVIDAVSIYLYIEKSLVPTAILFVFYVVIAVYGYFSWKRKLNAPAMVAMPHDKVETESNLLAQDNNGSCDTYAK